MVTDGEQEDTDEFRALIEVITEPDTDFKQIFDFYLNQELDQCTNCTLSSSKRRLLRAVKRRHVTILIESEYDPYFNFTRELALEIGKLPLGYQGLFVNDPPVIADMIILIMIVFGFISCCAIFCWCCHREPCYPNMEYNKFEDEFVHEKNDNRNQNGDVYALPLKK